jgi:predicted nucleic acid-binding protein
MLFDTDVLIWVQRGSIRAAREVDKVEAPRLSVVTYMEIVEGARNKAELKGIRETMARFGLTVLPVNEAIGHKAALYLEEHRLKSGLDLVDALVAATATTHSLTLCTANARHFRPIAGLEVKAFRP